MHMNRFNLFLFATMALLIAGLWTCNSCQKAEIARLKSEPTANVQPVQVTATDTVRIKEAVDVPVYVPKPYAVIHEKVRVDSFTAYEVRPVDTAAILKDYLAKVVYIDSQAVEHGTVYITDTVTQNRIAARHIRAAFTIPEVTKTVTITEPAKRRTQLYAGINFQGTKADLLTGFGPSLMLKTKQDRVIEVGALYGRSGEITYQAGLKFKISFTKN